MIIHKILESTAPIIIPGAVLGSILAGITDCLTTSSTNRNLQTEQQGNIKRRNGYAMVLVGSSLTIWTAASATFLHINAAIGVPNCPTKATSLLFAAGAASAALCSAGISEIVSANFKVQKRS